MKIVGLIPARYSSTRFPGKPLAQICGKPMIQWVYERVAQVEDVDEVYVATDDERIYNAVVGFGGKAIMTSTKHICGTNRISEAADILELSDDDIVLNIQGDEPLITEPMVERLIETVKYPESMMGTLKAQIKSQDELDNTNVVKVITDKFDNAIYFSRYCIPFIRDTSNQITIYKHIGAYAYRRHFLHTFSEMRKSTLEKAESLEQLRAIENGFKIKVLESHVQSIGVDTPEQLQEVEKIIRKDLVK